MRGRAAPYARSEVGPDPDAFALLFSGQFLPAGCGGGFLLRLSLFRLLGALRAFKDSWRLLRARFFYEYYEYEEPGFRETPAMEGMRSCGAFEPVEVL